MEAACCPRCAASTVIAGGLGGWRGIKPRFVPLNVRPVQWEEGIALNVGDVYCCTSCGLTYDDFRKFGRFGCAHCYLAFKVQLKTLLKKIHGSNVHLGKAPLKLMPIEGVAAPAVSAAAVEAAPPVDPIELLRQQLHEAIEHEDFERAALLRDKLHELEGRA